MYKKLFISIFSLFILCVLMNFIYTQWFYEADLQEHSGLINKVREIPDNADIIYMGESSNTNHREEDLDHRSISAFIGDYFPDLLTCDITKNASHAGIYYVLLENIPKKNQTKTIIVTLNLRSFNAQWIYSDLETPLQKSLVLIKNYPPLVNRLLLSFKAYNTENTVEREEQFKAKWEKDVLNFPYDFPFRDVIQWDKWMAVNGIKDEDGNNDDAKTVLACHYIKGFAFQIDTLTNPRIKDFNKIIKLAKKREWNLVFNLLADNTEKAGELVGDDLIFLLEENRKLLISYFEARGVTVVDNLNAVPDEQFTDRNWTTEHYGEKGRKIIARNVAVEMKKWYPD